MKKFIWNLNVWLYRQIYRLDIVKSQTRKALEYNLFYLIYKEVKPKKILFVGVAPYTRYYYRLFPNVAFKTIDKDPGTAGWGTPGHHTSIDTMNAIQVFDEDTFDVVILNGVYGWGTNTAQHLHKVLENIHKILRPDGLLLFGWNQTKEFDPLDIENNLSNFFSKYTIKSLQGSNRIQYYNWQNHTFRFFQASKGNTIEI